MTIMIPTWVDGELTPVEKLEAHQRGLRHKAVSIFIMRGNEILIQRRAMSKYHTPGLWANTCCTHPEWHESSLDCATRRLQEELGITGVTPIYRDTIEYRADVGNGLIEHEVVDLFTGHASADLDVIPNPDEVMETRWMTFRELQRTVSSFPNRFTPWLRIYLQDHSAKIFGTVHA